MDGSGHNHSARFSSKCADERTRNSRSCRITVSGSFSQLDRQHWSAHGSEPNQSERCPQPITERDCSAEVEPEPRLVNKASRAEPRICERLCHRLTGQRTAIRTEDPHDGHTTIWWAADAGPGQHHPVGGSHPQANQPAPPDPPTKRARPERGREPAHYCAATRGRSQRRSAVISISSRTFARSAPTVVRAGYGAVR